MSGLYGTVLLRKPFEVYDTGRVTAILQEFAEEVEETRRGRHWDIVVENYVGYADVEPTTSGHSDYEEILLDVGLDYEEVPEAIEISFGSRSEPVRFACEVLCERLASELEGVDCGVRY